MIGNKYNMSSLNSTSERKRKETEGQSEDDRSIVEVRGTDKGDVMSAENFTAIHDRESNVCDYHQAGSFVKIKQICETIASIHLALIKYSLHEHRRV